MDNEDKHWWLYVLKLEQEKYYVGITSMTPEQRMKQHTNGFGGARWTRKYKPTQLFYKKDLGETTLERAQQYENKVTRKYMKKYGINSVRGGDLTDPVDYVKHFGRLFDKEGWLTAVVVLMLSLMLLFVVLKDILF